MALRGTAAQGGPRRLAGAPVAGGQMGELNAAFARLAATTYKRAWRRGPDHPSIRRAVEILRRATEEIEQEWERPQGGPEPERTGT